MYKNVYLKPTWSPGAAGDAGGRYAGFGDCGFGGITYNRNKGFIHYMFKMYCNKYYFFNCYKYYLIL